MKWIIKVLFLALAVSAYGQKISEMDSMATLSTNDTIWFPVMDPNEAVAADRNKRVSLYRLDQRYGTGGGVGSSSSGELLYNNSSAVDGTGNFTYNGTNLSGSAGQILMHGGSTSNPSYSFTGNANYGMTFVGGALNMVSNGGVALTFSGSSNQFRKNLTFDPSGNQPTIYIPKNPGSVTLDGAMRYDNGDSQELEIYDATDAEWKTVSGTSVLLTDYTPTEVDSTNVDSHSFLMGFYTNSNGNVLLQLSGQINPTASGAVYFSFSLPVTAGMSTGDIIGHGQSDQSGGRILVDRLSGGSNARLIFPGWKSSL